MRVVGMIVGAVFGFVIAFLVKWIQALFLGEVFFISAVAVVSLVFLYLIFRYVRYNHQNFKSSVAYIDGNNLHQGVKNLGWKLDYGGFRHWLKDKYNAEKVIIFIGYLKEYENLYSRLREYGYELHFKEVSYGEGGKVKGNIDPDLVQKVMEDYCDGTLKNKSVVIVSGDGDYASTVKFLKKKKMFNTLIVPSNEGQVYGNKRSMVSIQLKRLNIRIDYIGNHRNILDKKKGRPAKTIHRKTPFHHNTTMMPDTGFNVKGKNGDKVLSKESGK